MKIDIEISYQDIAEKIPYFELLSFDKRLTFMQFLITALQDEINAQKEVLLEQIMFSDNYRQAFSQIADDLESLKQENEDDE